MKVNTQIFLRSQFHNMWEGQKPASLEYKALYVGDDELYKKSYEENLVKEICTQADFWDCVMSYNESYSVEVLVLDDIGEKEKIEKHLTSLILADMKQKTGKNPEDSFLDTMSEEKKKEIEDGVAAVKRNFPGLF